MNRQELEHIIRATADMTGEDDIIVFGSQAILGQFPDAPLEMLVSDEADVFPMHRRELADLIDANMGEFSMFHTTHGFYAQGVAHFTPSFPEGWRDRLIPVRNPNTNDKTGWCVEIHDIVISKYVAGREKDHRYNRAAIRHGLVRKKTLLARLKTTPVVAEHQQIIRGQILQDYANPLRQY